MNTWPFFRYFLHYIFFAKTRQRLLFIAVVGLFLSAFALMVVQGIMGGLQKGLINRSKEIHGSYVIKFSQITNEPMDEIREILLKEGVHFYSELEAEVMLRHKAYVAPARVHGLVLSDERPQFLADKDFSGLVMGSELASKVKIQYLDDIQLIAPGVTDNLMGEIPRFISEMPSDYLYTELPEVDEFEAWGRVEIVQNLLRQRGINQIRIFGQVPENVVNKIESIKTEVPFRLMSWEEMNGALVWSLNLETKVMLFLFISMSLLVAIAITSGLLIFYSKIRRDLMSFWILGMARETLIKLCFRFTVILSLVTVISGGIFGYSVLKILENYGHQLVPDIFVERQVPVELGLSHVILSLLIPFSISLIFSWFSFAHFRKENQSFVAIVRSVG